MKNIHLFIIIAIFTLYSIQKGTIIIILRYLHEVLNIFTVLLGILVFFFIQ